MQEDIGIYRKIPLNNIVKRTDGTKSNNKAEITDIRVSEEHTIYKEGGYEVIQIGDSTKTVEGMQTYTIKYNYNIGKDPLKNADELYFNLIGDEWDTSISNVTFKITMPKSFDENLLGFSSGIKGSTNNSNVSYNVNGNVISGYLTNTLNAGEALTVRLTLPEGYFVNTSKNIDMYYIYVIIFSLVCVLIAYILWAKYGKDNGTVVETVEFYPPEGYNSADVGFLYYGEANTQSIVSLLIYLANKGYIKIEEIEQPALFGKVKNYKITKVKEYDGNNENEKIFLEGLFEEDKTMDRIILFGKEYDFSKAKEAEGDTPKKESVLLSELKNNFYRTIDKIKENLNSTEKEVFETPRLGKGKWLTIMIVAIFVLITAKPIYEYSGMSEALAISMFIGAVLIMISDDISKELSKAEKVGLIIVASIGIIIWAVMLFPTLTDSVMYLTEFIGVICIAVLYVFKRIMPKRTAYGNEILGKLRGFKRFLEVAEKPQLESLVEENPEYFYDILPYTYALGVSDVWIKQFETIAIKPPDWCDTGDNFDIHTFGAFINETMQEASSSMSSGGDSDGGGSSGDGSGGGGGGSW